MLIDVNQAIKNTIELKCPNLGQKATLFGFRVNPEQLHKSFRINK